MSERPQRLAQQGLQVHLPRVDDVVDPARVPEGRHRGIAVLRGGRPERATARLASEEAIVKVAPEQAELPELIREVLANVRHDAIRPDDNLFARVLGPSKLGPYYLGPSKLGPYVGPSKLGPYVVALLFDPHHPAARQPAF